MSSSKKEIKPMISIKESNLDITIDVVIDGLRVKSSCFKPNRPFNFKVLKKEFEFQSLDLLIELNDKNSEARTFRYKVDRLPTEINVGKTKLKYFNDRITIDIVKLNNELWMPYVSYDLETNPEKLKH